MVERREVMDKALEQFYKLLRTELKQAGIW
jgi:hypothetical protein